MDALEIFRDLEQGSDEWIKARLGIVTCSEFKSVLAKGEGKVRRKYLLTVLAEKLSGQPLERYTNAFMERGHTQEDEARDLYSLLTDNEVERIGFMKRGPVGYSPDGLIGNDGLLEVKTKMGHLHLECLLSNKVPPENMQQCQGGLWVSSRQWIDFVSYSPGLELFVKRVERDESAIARIKVEVDAFLTEMAALEAQYHNYRRAA